MMTPNELLDEILNLFASGNYTNGESMEILVKDYVIRAGKNLEEQEKWFSTIENRLIKVVDKLIIDKYIILKGDTNDIPPASIYIITFEGYVFSSNGGYVEKEKRKKSTKNLKNIQSWAIAIGAALAGLSVLYSFLKYIFCCT